MPGVSPFAPPRFPALPPVAGVRFAGAATGLKKVAGYAEKKKVTICLEYLKADDPDYDHGLEKIRALAGEPIGMPGAIASPGRSWGLPVDPDARP